MEQERNNPKMLPREHIEDLRPPKDFSNKLINVKEKPHNYFRSVLIKSDFSSKNPNITIQDNNGIQRANDVLEANTKNMNKNGT